MPIITAHVTEPWFSALAAGAKTVEGRVNDGKFAALVSGNLVNLRAKPTPGVDSSAYGSSFGHDQNVDLNEQVTSTTLRDVDIRSYSNFETLLTQEETAQVFPGIPTDQALGVCNDIYSEKHNLIVKSGVLAIEFALPFSVQVGQGWLPVIYTAWARLASLDAELEVADIREKYGTLRINVSPWPSALTKPELSTAVSSIFEIAEAASERTCEATPPTIACCGSASGLDPLSTQGSSRRSCSRRAFDAPSLCSTRRCAPI